MGERPPISAERANDLAGRALAHIANDIDLARALLDASGAGPEALRSMASQPEFAAFVLDFLLENDARVLAFAAAEGISPEQVMAARSMLDGALTHWL